MALAQEIYADRTIAYERVVSSFAILGLFAAGEEQFNQGFNEAIARHCQDIFAMQQFHHEVVEG